MTNAYVQCVAEAIVDVLTPADGGEARFVEVQGTAEGVPFSRPLLNTMLDYAEAGIATLVALQNEARS